jgi:hypothetical protein
MSIRILDRLHGKECEVPGGATVLSRYIVSPAPGCAITVNSFAVSDRRFVVPDSRGHWQVLSGDADRVDGTFPRAQALDALDSSSIREVGRSVAEFVDAGGSWIDVIRIPPLVPEMSKRAEFLPFEETLSQNMGHLAEVCSRPRMHLRVEVERTAVARARRIPGQAANYLAAHTEDWERPTLRAVVPKRILSEVREDQFDIYENRIAVRLVDHLVTYLGRRIFEISRLLRVFEEAGDYSASAAGGTHWRQRRIYQLWGDAVDAGEARRKAERTLRQLERLKRTVAGLMDSVLYRGVPGRTAVKSTLTMTNILSNDAHYRRVADLWIAWARLETEKFPQPHMFFADMQDLCQSFDRYSLLLTLRAFAQLRFEPTATARPLSDGEIELHRGRQTAVVSWSGADGAITINGRGIDGLRIVPLCSSIAALDSEHLRHLVNDADRGASDSDIVVLYPTPPTSEVYKRLDRELARRLHALSHEVASAGRRRVGFLPVSPWDIGSVERVARQVRWITMTPKFRGYPPTIKRPSGLDLRRASAWLKPSADSICVLRTPREHEQLPVAQEVEAAISRVAELEIEHKLVSRNLQDVHRQGAATGGLNSRKKALNAEITAAETQLKELQGFRAELSDAIASVEDLLRCPTCENRADPSHDFASDAGHRFSCACPGCGTKWDNRRCTQCQAWIPTLLPSSSSWEGHVRELGWIDRTLGADVLATPVVVGTEIAYICPSCGAGPEATDNP